MAFHRNQLCWPVALTKRSFRVYVVEPHSYSPPQHAEVFNAAISGLLTPPVPEVSSSGDYNTHPKREPFDLVTFPEAFLMVDDLVAALDSISALSECGCVHLGLRATSGDRHLFRIDEIKTLVQKLRQVSALEETDLSTFSAWLDAQPHDYLFNIGCIFMLDANRKLRVCLHPKAIKSKFETSMLHENNMTEANMLTLVSLIPEDKRFFSITIQPLLCSDALNLETDRPGARPLYAANQDSGEGAEKWSPDHIDIVSLATCTPQPEYGEPPNTYSQWHPAFQDAFHRAASDDNLLKHHHAIFVLSNFRMVADSKSGGLSGAFIPVPLNDDQIPDYLTVSVWGHPEKQKQPNNWSKPNEPPSREAQWLNFGYIASLCATDATAATRMMGFTVDRLPRQASRWHKNSGLTDFQLFVASIDEAGSRLTFKQQDYS